MNKRRTIILPYKSVIDEKTKVTHMQIMKNEKIKSFEIRLFYKDKLIKKITVKDMTLKIVQDNGSFFLKVDDNQVKKEKLFIDFQTNITLNQIQNLVQTIII